MQTSNDFTLRQHPDLVVAPARRTTGALVVGGLLAPLALTAMACQHGTPPAEGATNVRPGPRAVPTSQQLHPGTGDADAVDAAPVAGLAGPVGVNPVGEAYSVEQLQRRLPSDSTYHVRARIGEVGCAGEVALITSCEMPYVQLAPLAEAGPRLRAYVTAPLRNNLPQLEEREGEAVEFMVSTEGRRVTLRRVLNL